jgi:lactoylglutathione lyase
MIRVKDLEKSLDFYCHKLGLIECNRYESSEGRFTLVYLHAPEDAELATTTNAPLLELTYNWDAEHYPSGRNFGHIAYEVENIYETCQKLLAAGVIINRPPRDGRMAFIRCPDAISIEFLQKGEPLGLQEPWKSMENTGSW